MSAMKKALIGAAGAIASYYAVKAVTKMLDEKPLEVRVREAREMLDGWKSTAVSTANEKRDAVNEKMDSLLAKLDSLVKEKE